MPTGIFLTDLFITYLQNEKFDNNQNIVFHTTGILFQHERNFDNGIFLQITLISF